MNSKRHRTLLPTCPSSLYQARWSCKWPCDHMTPRAVYHTCSTSTQCDQAERFERSLQEVCGDWEGVCEETWRGMANPQDFPKQSWGTLCPSQGCISSHGGSWQGKGNCHVPCKSDFSAVLQPSFGGGMRVQEQDPAKKINCSPWMSIGEVEYIAPPEQDMGFLHVMYHAPSVDSVLPQRSQSTKVWHK